MPIRPKDFLRLAEQLASKSDEASLRTAISRAYYALLLNGREILEDRFRYMVPRGPEEHKFVPRKLKRVGVHERIADFVTLAEEIEKFRLIRCEADYDIDKPFRSQAEVKMLVERAKRVKEHI